MGIVAIAYGFYDPYFYGPYGYPYYGQGYYYDLGSVRLQVKPEDTEVYVDGYYVGVVDEYDGVFQRLRLPSSEHEIELYPGRLRERPGNALPRAGRNLQAPS